MATPLRSTASHSVRSPGSSPAGAFAATDASSSRMPASATPPVPAPPSASGCCLLDFPLEKDLCCPFCSSSFKRCGHLTRHLRRRHPPGRYLFRCLGCSIHLSGIKTVKAHQLSCSAFLHLTSPGVLIRTADSPPAAISCSAPADQLPRPASIVAPFLVSPGLHSSCSSAGNVLLRGAVFCSSPDSPRLHPPASRPNILLAAANGFSSAPRTPVLGPPTPSRLPSPALFVTPPSQAGSISMDYPATPPLVSHALAPVTSPPLPAPKSSLAQSQPLPVTPRGESTWRTFQPGKARAHGNRPRVSTHPAAIEHLHPSVPLLSPTATDSLRSPCAPAPAAGPPVPPSRGVRNSRRRRRRLTRTALRGEVCPSWSVPVSAPWPWTWYFYFPGLITGPLPLRFVPGGPG